MNPITLDHLEQGAKDAIEAREHPVTINGEALRFGIQSYHECGSSACILGFASMRAGNTGSGIEVAAGELHSALRFQAAPFGDAAQQGDMRRAVSPTSDGSTAPERVLSIIAEIRKGAKS